MGFCYQRNFVSTAVPPKQDIECPVWDFGIIFFTRSPSDWGHGNVDCISLWQSMPILEDKVAEYTALPFFRQTILLYSSILACGIWQVDIWGSRPQESWTRSHSTTVIWKLEDNRGLCSTSRALCCENLQPKMKKQMKRLMSGLSQTERRMIIIMTNISKLPFLTCDVCFFQIFWVSVGGFYHLLSHVSCHFSFSVHPLLTQLLLLLTLHY